MDFLSNIPDEILSDPRHLIPACRDCRHTLEIGLCGLDLHPNAAWATEVGCPFYDPLVLDGGGDPDPEAPMEYTSEVSSAPG